MPRDASALRASTIEAPAPATRETNTGDSHPIAHVARDPYERPLVALCGKVARDSTLGTYRGELLEQPLPCVVCAELHGKQADGAA